MATKKAPHPAPKKLIKTFPNLSEIKVEKIEQIARRMLNTKPAKH